MNKYGNKKAVRNGITFDSQKEAARYDQLMLRLCAGEIRDLKLQPEFTLQEAFTTPLIVPMSFIPFLPIRPIKYICRMVQFRYQIGENR